MQRALDLARRAKGRTSPNPLVGAVIVKEERVIGEGYHQKAGTPHAEVHALNVAGEAAKGATLYTNLEPCCHWGRTPPCTAALIQSRYRAGLCRGGRSESECRRQGGSTTPKCGYKRPCRGL